MKLLETSGNPFPSGTLSRPRKPPLEQLEIDTGLQRRWVGWIGYVLIVLVVCALFVFLFVQFTGSYRLAVVLVAFLVLYMSIMGWIASRNAERDNTI